MRGFCQLIVSIIVVQFLILPTMSARASEPRPFKAPVNEFLVPKPVSSPVVANTVMTDQKPVGTALDRLIAKGRTVQGELEEPTQNEDSRAQEHRIVPGPAKKASCDGWGVCGWKLWTTITGVTLGVATILAVGIAAARGDFASNRVNMEVNVDRK